MACCPLAWQMWTICGESSWDGYTEKRLNGCRARVNPVANVKIKNNLLAITLILTALPLSVRVSREVVEQVCFVLGQNFGAGTERPEVSQTSWIIRPRLILNFSAWSHRNALCRDPSPCVSPTSSFCITQHAAISLPHTSARRSSSPFPHDHLLSRSYRPRIHHPHTR